MFNRASILAALFAAFTLSSVAGAGAETRIPYQVGVAKDCFFVSCALSFPKTDNGRRVDVHRINCRITSPKQLQDAWVYTDLGVVLFLAPTWVRSVGGSNIYTIDQSVEISVKSGASLIAVALLPSTGSVEVICSLFGELVFLP